MNQIRKCEKTGSKKIGYTIAKHSIANPKQIEANRSISPLVSVRYGIAGFIAIVKI
jgi:hypothetical protein